MATGGIQGSITPQQQDVLQQAGLSVTKAVHEGKEVLVLNTATPTKGLRRTGSDDHDTVDKKEYPSIRDRVTRRASKSETHSIKKRLIPDTVAKYADKLKTRVTDKTNALSGVITSKAQTLKSLTLGKLLRAIKHESWQPVDVSSGKGKKLQEMFKQHNADIKELESLKDQLKTESEGLKEFEAKYKDALELLNHPGKFISCTKPTIIQTPAGERTIHAIDTSTRQEMVDLIREEVRSSGEFKEYENTMLEQASDGTELYQERQVLKGKMKTNAKIMLALQKVELEEQLEIDKDPLEKEKSTARKLHNIQSTFTEQASESDLKREKNKQEAEDLLKKVEKQIDADINKLDKAAITTRKGFKSKLGR